MEKAHEPKFVGFSVFVVGRAGFEPATNGLKVDGAFATPDAVPSQFFARQTLAITTAMKPDVQRVVQIETTGKPMVQIESKIAPQAPIKLYPGNGNQVFFDYPKGSIRTEYVKPLGPTQPLPVTVTPAAKKNKRCICTYRSLMN